LLVVTALVAWLASDSLGGSQASASLTRNFIILAFLLASLIAGWRGTASLALKYALMWVAVFGIIIVGYAYRTELQGVWQRVSGELNPAAPIERTASEVSLRRADDGHFYADTDINGTTVRLLADTGATMVALSETDAESVGIDVDQLNYTRVVSTANGQALAAPITLDEVRIGSIVRHDVKAMVARGLEGSLLGMSFFNSLSKVAIENEELILRD
jgi:aspartyl protease family protein